MAERTRMFETRSNHMANMEHAKDWPRNTRELNNRKSEDQKLFMNYQ